MLAFERYLLSPSSRYENTKAGVPPSHWYTPISTIPQSLTSQNAILAADLHVHGRAVEHVWNVMAHAQKPDLVFQRNGRVHLNWRGRQFSRLLAAAVCTSAVVMVVMLDTPRSVVQCKTTGYPLHSPVSPSLPLPCVTVCHQVSTELYRRCPFLAPCASLPPDAHLCMKYCVTSSMGWIYCLTVLSCRMGFCTLVRNSRHASPCLQRSPWC